MGIYFIILYINSKLNNMKKITYITLFAVLITSLSLSCLEPEPEESCDGNDLADDFCEQLDIDLIATFCSDGEANSYYIYNGETYECDGVESSTCDTALDDITAQMRVDEPECFAKSGKESFKAAKTRLSNTAEKLLMDVRLNSLNKGSLNF